MARYFDASTGEYVDTETQGQATIGNSSGAVQTPSSQQTMSGMKSDITPLEKMLGLGALMKKDYTGAGNFLLTQETADQKNRKVALKPAKMIVQKAMTDTYRNTGPQMIPANMAMKYLGGLGVPSSVKAQKARFALLKQNVVRAFQGAKMSDTDMAMAVDYVPDITDTPDTIKTKLGVLNEVLSNMIGE